MTPRLRVVSAAAPAAGGGGGSTPTLGASPSSLDVTLGALTYTLTGSNLVGNATVTAPIDFEVSTDGVSYAGSKTVAPSGGTIAGATIYVRKTTPAPQQDFTGNVANASSGAATVNVAAAYLGAGGGGGPP